MLWKLLKKTLIPSQLIGYFLAVTLGSTIALFCIQLYIDVQPLLINETNLFKQDFAVVSKKISIFKSIDKEKIYFGENEIEDLRNQPFVKGLSWFNHATFRISAFSEESDNLPRFRTDLFFESIPDKYVDELTEEWIWDSTRNYLPIIIPESYLKLYNFGFAESQGLPVISENTISQISFSVSISGNGRSRVFKSKIVGFSSRINSILVPENFLKWANAQYGRQPPYKINRLLVAFTNPGDERIVDYFNKENYAINKEKLELGKIVFFFKSALLFMQFIAWAILLLAVTSIFLSINLMIQKNMKVIQYLHNIGYRISEISMYYQIVVIINTMICITLAIIFTHKIRGFYSSQLEELFEMDGDSPIVITAGTICMTVLIALFFIYVRRSIQKTVGSKNT
mgnify:CR=1 FL=1